MKTYQLILLVLLSVSHDVAAGHDELPRVLILGDSVYRQPAAEIARQFKGKCEVVLPTVPAGQVFNSRWAVSNLESLLGEKRWDVIHVNVGLGDLVHCVPGLREVRVLPAVAGGVRATSPDEYRDNLTKIIARLKATDARVVWASTTPIRSSSTGVFVLGSEVEYNQIAAAVMKKHDVPVNDMYQSVKALIDMARPASHGADPFSFDKKPIHEPIAAAIVRMMSAEQQAQLMGGDAE